MTWTQALIAFGIGAGLVSLADWLFFGVAFHSKYFAYPEVWWPNNKWRVPVSGIIALLTPAAFVAFVTMLKLTDEHDVIHTAVLAWAMGPLPLLLVNAMFIKLHPLVTATHIVGWLAKFLAAAVGVIIAMMI